MAKQTLAVEGYRDLIRGLAVADKQTRVKSRQAFRHVGDIVKSDAANTMASVNTKTAAGYKVAIRQSGVEVRQSVRKVTGRHPEYGAYQMRHALRPAQVRNAPELERELEHAMDVVAAQFNTGGRL